MISKKVAAGVVALAIALPSAVAMAPAEAKSATSLSIKANHYYYKYGQRISLSTHLSVPNAKVSYFETVPGYRPVKIYAGTVNSSGNETIVGSVSENATFTVTYGGSSTHSAARATTRIKVTAKLVTKLTGYYSHKGKYKLIHAGKKGHFAAGMAPRKAGEHLSFPLQRYSHGKWRTVVRHKYKMNSKGVVAIWFKGVRGYKYRVRAAWAGDSRNRGVTGGWHYVKFV